jgi:putative membrane protein
MLKLNNRAFLRYKLFNSLFTGLSIGILITIYGPLDPLTYSIGGMVLAVGMLIIAKFYEKLLNIKSFYYISLMVEIMMLITVIIFIFLQFSLVSALLIYIGYQFTFTFGGYLIRAETLVAKDKELLGKIDFNKQLGYLIGLGASFVFYYTLKNGFEIVDPESQIMILHYLLIILQVLIVLFLKASFSRKEIRDVTEIKN